MRPLLGFVAATLAAGCISVQRLDGPLEFATRPPPRDATLGKVYAVLASLPIVERATQQCAPRLLVLESGDPSYSDENPREKQIEQAGGNLLVVWVVKEWTSTNEKLFHTETFSSNDYMGTLYACPDATLAAIVKEATP